MLMGHYFLEEMDIALERLNHRNFEQARDLVERNSDHYLARAEEKIADKLAVVIGKRERTLQLLSATFRRADLIDLLL